MSPPDFSVTEYPFFLLVGCTHVYADKLPKGWMATLLWFFGELEGYAVSHRINAKAAEAKRCAAKSTQPTLARFTSFPPSHVILLPRFVHL